MGRWGDKGTREQGEIFNAQCPMPNAQCPMPNARLPITNYQFPFYATAANNSVKLLATASSLETISTILLREAGSSSDSTQT